MSQQLLQENCNFELQSKDGAKIPKNYLLFRLLTTFVTLLLARNIDGHVEKTLKNRRQKKVISS